VQLTNTIFFWGWRKNELAHGQPGVVKGGKEDSKNNRLRVRLSERADTPHSLSLLLR
jgi:hypothetical protein